MGGRSTVEADRTAKAQMQPKIKRKNTQGITYFGLVWKKHKNDSSVLRADDVIHRSKYGVASSTKPICCLCRKPYSPDLMYIRCERCRSKSISPMTCHCSSKQFSLCVILLTFPHLDILLYTDWFHGDALRLEEKRIVEVVSYRCCRCRRRAIPGCPHSDDYYHKSPEPEYIIQESSANIPSSEEAVGAEDEDPSSASFGRFKQTVDADRSVHMESFVPGSNQEMNFVDDSSHPAHPFDKVEIIQVMKDTL